MLRLHWLFHFSSETNFLFLETNTLYSEIDQFLKKKNVQF